MPGFSAARPGSQLLWDALLLVACEGEADERRSDTYFPHRFSRWCPQTRICWNLFTQTCEWLLQWPSFSQGRWLLNGEQGDEWREWISGFSRGDMRGGFLLQTCWGLKGKKFLTRLSHVVWTKINIYYCYNLHQGGSSSRSL